MNDTKGNARSSAYAKAENDWYQESAACVDMLLKSEPLHGLNWDPACGGGNIPRRCAAAGHECIGSDLVDRGAGFTVFDFLRDGGPRINIFHQCRAQMDRATNIITNPPFSAAQEFVEHALRMVPGKVIVLQRLAWLEGQKRRQFFLNTGLSRVWVHSSRISMPPGGSDITPIGGAVAYAWFVWARTPPGQHPTLGWLA